MTKYYDEAFRTAQQLAEEHRPASCPDRHVETVRDLMRYRAMVGLNKYGVTTERTDLTRKQWLIHAQEEAMDLAIYLQTIIEMEP